MAAEKASTPDDGRPSEEGEGVPGYLQDVTLAATYRLPETGDGGTPHLACAPVGRAGTTCDVPATSDDARRGRFAGKCPGLGGGSVSCTVTIGDGSQLVAFGSSPVLSVGGGTLAFALDVTSGLAVATVDPAASSALRPLAAGAQGLALVGAWQRRCVPDAKGGGCTDTAPKTLLFADLPPTRTGERAIGAFSAKRWQTQCQKGLHLPLPGRDVALDLSSADAYGAALDQVFTALPAATQTRLRAVRSQLYANTSSVCPSGSTAGACAPLTSGPFAGETGVDRSGMREALTDLLFSTQVFRLQGDEYEQKSPCGNGPPASLAACASGPAAGTTFCTTLTAATDALAVEVTPQGTLVATTPSALTSLAQCLPGATVPAGAAGVCAELAFVVADLGLVQASDGHLVADPTWSDAQLTTLVGDVDPDDGAASLCPTAAAAATGGAPDAAACRSELVAMTPAAQQTAVSGAIPPPDGDAPFCPAAAAAAAGATPDGAACQAEFLALTTAQQTALVQAAAATDPTLQSALCADPATPQLLQSILSASCAPEPDEILYDDGCDQDGTCTPDLVCTSAWHVGSCLDGRGLYTGTLRGVEGLLSVSGADGAFGLTSLRTSTPVDRASCGMSAGTVTSAAFDGKDRITATSSDVLRRTCASPDDGEIVWTASLRHEVYERLDASALP